MMKTKRLTKTETALIGALEHAIQCVQWCRNHHVHTDEDFVGFPSEAVWLDLIAKAKGVDLNRNDELLRCAALAAAGKLDRAAIARATTPAGH